MQTLIQNDIRTAILYNEIISGQIMKNTIYIYVGRRHIIIQTSVCESNNTTSLAHKVWLEQCAIQTIFIWNRVFLVIF